MQDSISTPSSSSETKTLSDQKNKLDSNELIASMKEKVKVDDEVSHSSYLTTEDFRALKKSKYQQIKHKFQKSFVIQNLKNDNVVELHAASVVHACRFINWRPRHVKVLEERSNGPK